VYRIFVVSKNTKMDATCFDSVVPLHIDLINSFRALYEGNNLVVNTMLSIEARVPHVHLSPCGTMLVTTSNKASTAPDMLTIYRCDPERGWMRRVRHERVDSHSTISGTALKSPDSRWRELFGNCPYASSQKAHLLEWAYSHLEQTRTIESAFSPCAKYLATLTRSHIFVIDLHASLCHETLRVRSIRVSDGTRPLAIAWPDGLFVETTHGVWHIGTFDAASL
jgi:hypothetical protein